MIQDVVLGIDSLSWADVLGIVVALAGIVAKFLV